MNQTFDIELRESERPGYEPSLHGTIITEGRAASDGLVREVFTNGSVEWPRDGIAILTEHRGRIETRAHPVRHRDGRITFQTRATDEIRQAVASGKRYMSVEFRSISERTTASGVREILRALVDAAALTAAPVYDTTAAELRSRRRPPRFWL